MAWICCSGPGDGGHNASLQLTSCSKTRAISPELSLGAVPDTQQKLGIQCQGLRNLLPAPGREQQGTQGNLERLPRGGILEFLKDETQSRVF